MEQATSNEPERRFFSRGGGSVTMIMRGTGEWLGWGLSCCWLALSLFAATPAQAVEIIVNSDVGVQSISQSTLRAIFSMRLRQWPNGKPIKVFVLPDENQVHVSFAKEMLNTFPYQLRRSWDVLVFSGSGQAPGMAESPAEMLQRVASTPGAIGYLPSDYSIEGAKYENVRIVEPR